MVRDTTGHDESDWSRRRFVSAAGALGFGVVGAGAASADPNGRGRGRGKDNGRGKGRGGPLAGPLRGIVRKSYRYFEEFTDEDTGLAADRVDLAGGETTLARRTSPANIGLQLLSTVSANELRFLNDRKAKRRIRRVLATLEDVETWNGLFFRWYTTDDASIDVDFGGEFISTVDNGWLTAGLIVVGQAFPELRDRTSALVEAMDYAKLYDPAAFNPFDPDEPVGQMYGGYDYAAGELTDFHFGIFNTEPRVASYLAIGKGDVPKEHWWGMFRTFPPTVEDEDGTLKYGDWSWTNQQPEGEFRIYDGSEVWEGHYDLYGTKYVPSYGGSMFESLMPSLVMKERELSTGALGENNRRQAELQVEYARRQGYPAWGFSPCATPDGYVATGVNQLGVSGYDERERNRGLVTPHATFLATEYVPRAARENVKTFRKLGVDGPYGFYDSVDVLSGEITEAYLALDQAMSIAAATNYITDGALREYLHADPIGAGPEDVLAEETFTI